MVISTSAGLLIALVSALVTAKLMNALPSPGHVAASVRSICKNPVATGLGGLATGGVVGYSISPILLLIMCASYGRL